MTADMGMDTDTTRFERRFPLLLGAVTLLALLLRVAGLGSQPPSLDDYAVANTAVNYVEGGQLGPTMWNHPGLRNVLVYWSMQLFGAGAAGVKGWSVLSGTLSVPLLALVARRLTGSAVVGLTAAILWGMEPLAVDFSRQGINDIYLAFFSLAGIWLALRFRDGHNPWWLVAAGIAFGLGLASKWSVVFPLAVTGVLLLADQFRGHGETAGLRACRLAFLAASLAILPLTVYLLTFAPWFGRGYSLDEWPTLQKAMYRETKLHVGYQPTVTGDHRARQWFVRPVAFRESFPLVRREKNIPTEPGVKDKMVMLVAIANPLAWLPVLPAVAWTAWRGCRERRGMLLYLAALFGASYLPLAVAWRPIWVNTAVSVLPFAFMAVSWAMWDILGCPPRRRMLLAAWLALTVAVSASLYPLAIGKGLQIPVVRDYLLEHYADDNPHGE